MPDIGCWSLWFGETSHCWSFVGLRGGLDPAHVATEIAVIVVLMAGVHAVSTRASKAVLTSLALVSCSGLLVHLTNGLIESHFHFFVVIPLISLYRDWRPLAVGLGLRRDSSLRRWSDLHRRMSSTILRLSPIRFAG